jgi:hypothetical protein
MANRIKITFSAQPTPFYVLTFAVLKPSLSYVNSFSKVFITGVPTAPGQVQIGSTLLDTMDNLLDSFVNNNLDGNNYFTLNSSGDLYIDFNIAADYEFILFEETTAPAPTFTLETITISENITLPDLDLKHLQILIYDTYINDLPLIVEYAQRSACSIQWDAGDDLYKSLMVSELNFNMRVSNFVDAHFKHLITGDENRYRVEVNAINEDDDSQLIWQGFLLPDQYDEPYTNNNLFVDFKATDMLGTLKGKYLESWFYRNSFPIAEVLAMCLNATGLTQNLIVKPALVPESPLSPWNTIAVNMNDYIDDKGKTKDLYTVLSSVLNSQGLTLASYRGFWWMEGINRKHEINNSALQFDTEGKLIVGINLSKSVKDALFNTTPNIRAITPWKKVNVNFNSNGTNNLFSDNLVKLSESEIFSTTYTTGNYVGSPAPTSVSEVYNTGKIKDWTANLNSEFFYIQSNFKRLMWRAHTILTNAFYYSDYNYNEAAVLNNWLQCPEKPYVKPGVLYRLEMEMEIDGMNVYRRNSDLVKTNLAAGLYDKLFPFQVFLNGIEKFSNRPSFGGLRYVPEASFSGVGDENVNIKFRLKHEFRVENDGYLSIKLLMPIFKNTDGSIMPDDQTHITSGCFFYCNALKLSVVEGIAENDNTIAVRDINYTQELDYPIDISCTPDNSVVNSFKIGSPINSNYVNTISRSVSAYDVTNYNYFAPTTLLELVLATFKIDYNLLNFLFAEEKIKNCFLAKGDGTQILFDSLWYYFNNPVSRLGYLKTYEGFPVIPKNYQAFNDVVLGDELKYIDVKYGPETYANRVNWKIPGYSAIESYPKTLAKILFGVQPETLYAIEGTHLGLIFPNDLLNFYFENQSRDFIPTRLTLDLFNGKTNVTATEAKFVELEDINYE